MILWIRKKIRAANTQNGNSVYPDSYKTRELNHDLLRLLDPDGVEKPKRDMELVALEVLVMRSA